jgi:hypothetical protein
MRAAYCLALLLACVLAWAAPPVTQEDALAFHKDGLCSIGQPGTGLHRKDGDGWIVSPLPGKHELRVEGGNVSPAVIDMTPGWGYRIHVEPQGATVEWCPAFKPAGRDACGPVPSALLWDAKKATDR